MDIDLTPEMREELGLNVSYGSSAPQQKEEQKYSYNSTVLADGQYIMADYQGYLTRVEIDMQRENFDKIHPDLVGEKGDVPFLEYLKENFGFDVQYTEL